MKICVLGIGNPLLGDDGFGVEVVKKLMGELPDDVEVIDGGSLGIYLLPYIQDKTHIIVVDAINFGGIPGQIKKFKSDEIPSFINMKISEHQITFHEVLALMKLLKIQPDDFIIIGVQPKSNVWGEPLSEEVKSAIYPVINEIKNQIDLWRKSNNATDECSLHTQ